MSRTETLQFRGILTGHNGWVTALATSESNPDILVSSSRDKSAIVWQLTPGEENFGYAKRSLRGHSHIVQDVQISQDGSYAITASWDKTLRLWSLQDGTSTRFVGHEGDVLSATFSPDNNMVISGSRDKTIRMWNILGEPIYVLQGARAHEDWVSAVAFPADAGTCIVSASHDKTIKVWDGLSGNVTSEFLGHTNYINSLVLAPDGTIAASGGKDGQILIWNLETNSFYYDLPCGDEIHAFAFSPSRFWLAAATASGIKIYSLNERRLIEEVKPEVATGREPTVISLTWSADGQHLFSGYTDGAIRVWQVMSVVPTLKA